MTTTRSRLVGLGIGLSAVCAATALAHDPAAAAPPRSDSSPTFVYTSTNSTSGNAVEAFEQKNNGSLKLKDSYATGGTGSSLGGGQGSVTLSRNGRTLLVVNAGSNQVSDFAVAGDGSLRLRGVVSSGGSTPTSVAITGDLVEVLNIGANPNVAGFTATNAGLVPLAGGSKPLSGAASGAEDVLISPDGAHVVVTEKNSNSIDVFSVNVRGKLSPAVNSGSDTPLAFSAVFGRDGRLFVADDGATGTSAVSVYSIRHNASISPAQPSVPDAQTAACWIAAGRHGDLFVDNAGSGSVSSYRVLGNGRLAFFGNTSLGAGAKPLDDAVSSAGTSLFTVDAGNNVIDTFTVSQSGITATTTAAIPAGSIGIAAT